MHFNKFRFDVLVDKYVMFLTSSIPKRENYINAISLPVSFFLTNLKNKINNLKFLQDA